MPHDLDHELAELLAPGAIRCASCGTPFPLHGDAGGPVRVVVGGWSSPANGIPLTCPGFRWVALDGPPVGSYREPPELTAPA